MERSNDGMMPSAVYSTLMLVYAADVTRIGRELSELEHRRTCGPRGACVCRFWELSVDLAELNAEIMTLRALFGPYAALGPWSES